jgi:hypothetical protein
MIFRKEAENEEKALAFGLRAIYNFAAIPLTELPEIRL